ncbi:MAG TPA: hypothetical protein VG984_02515 [Candidatus Paceibacterota bacterium]|nr:hypothetical protein [Candidatus Paceibacterota bacterium]
MEKKFTEAEFQEFVVNQFGALHADIKDIKADITVMKSDMSDMKDILYPLAKAFDIDIVTLADHGKRLTRVENHLGFGQA